VEVANADLPPVEKPVAEVSPKPPKPVEKKTSPAPSVARKETPKPAVHPVTPLERPRPKVIAVPIIPPRTIKPAEPLIAEAPPPIPAKPAKEKEKEPVKKVDPPSADEQKRLMAEIDEVYKPGECQDQAAKATLARKLLEDGRKNEASRAEQFVLLRRAGELACDAGEPNLMLEAVDAIVEAGFNIQPFRVKARLLSRLLEHGFLESPSRIPLDKVGDLRLSENASQISTLIDSCVTFAEAAAADGAFDEASGVLDAAREALVEPKKRAQRSYRAARAAAARTRNPADRADRDKKVQEAEAQQEAINVAQSALAECAKGLQQARHERETIQAALDRLKTQPDDPDTCLAVGRWYCFTRGEWDEGLKLLAKGSDGVLKAMAAKDIASEPSTAEAKIARGDVWWDLAEKTAGSDKSAMRRRAAHWYREAIGEVAAGLAKARLEQRLAQVAEDKSPEPAAAGRVRPPLAVAPFSEKAAKLHQAHWAKYLRQPVVQTNSIGMKLVLIPPGEFDMGSTKETMDEELRLYPLDAWSREHLSGETTHRVRITKPFRLGMTVVTQEEYERVMGNNPSKFQGDPKRPVEMVSWNDATEFCRRLADLPGEKAAKRRYDLPTEAQWEHACRAGTTTPFFFGDDYRSLTDYGWIEEGPTGSTHPVGQKRANVWGLYDMQGQVGQWCRDWYSIDYYGKSPRDDPEGPSEGLLRTARGGRCSAPPWSCYSARRNASAPSLCHAFLGFRVCAAPLEK
jgi:formylglycine-generating enzyme required for sulfatase activity